MHISQPFRHVRTGEIHDICNAGSGYDTAMPSSRLFCGSMNVNNLTHNAFVSNIFSNHHSDIATCNFLSASGSEHSSDLFLWWELSFFCSFYPLHAYLSTLQTRPDR